jgi:hypothetical protein
MGQINVKELKLLEAVAQTRKATASVEKQS